jgi:peptidoglycan/LPS O-acetylase OafA/YrhL
LIASRSQVRLGGLDYLRGFACLLVVCFHYFNRGPNAGWTNGAQFPDLARFFATGHYGVQLFFMISGFVIYRSAHGRDVLTFTKARLWRLFPAYWVGILLTTVTVVVLGAKQFWVAPGDFFLNFTMLQNWFKAKNVDGAYWSLQVEIVFYAWVAVMIGFGWIAKTERWVFLWLLVCLVNLYLDSYWIDQILVTQWGAFFAIGVLSEKLSANHRQGSLWALMALAIAVALTRSYLDLSRDGTAYWGASMLTLVVMIAIFMAMALPPKGWSETWLSRTCGALTYPLYLLHHNIGFALIAVLYPVVNGWWAVTFTFLTVLLASVGVNRWVERRLVGYLKTART